MTAAEDMRPLGEVRAVPAKLAVTRLSLTNFRSYAAGELTTAGAHLVSLNPIRQTLEDFFVEQVSS